MNFGLYLINMYLCKVLINCPHWVARYNQQENGSEWYWQHAGKQKSTAGGLQEQRQTCIKWCKTAVTRNKTVYYDKLGIRRKSERVHNLLQNQKKIEMSWKKVRVFTEHWFVTCLRQHKKVKQLIQSSRGKQDGMQRVRASWGLRIPLCTDEWEMEGERWDLISLFSTFCPVARKYTVLAMELTFYVLGFHTLCPQANCILTQYAFPELKPPVTMGCSSRQKCCTLLCANPHH